MPPDAFKVCLKLVALLRLKQLSFEFQFVLCLQLFHQGEAEGLAGSAHSVFEVVVEALDDWIDLHETQKVKVRFQHDDEPRPEVREVSERNVQPVKNESQVLDLPRVAAILLFLDFAVAKF